MDFDFAKIGQMMSAAKDMKENLDARLADTDIEADSGGGAVRVKMNGRKQLLRLTIAPAAAQAAAGDISMLEDLIVAAVNAGWNKADAAAQTAAKSMASGMLGGMELPDV